jgi:hypothetical protein
MKGLWSASKIYKLVLSMMTYIKPTAGYHSLQDMFGMSPRYFAVHAKIMLVFFFHLLPHSKEYPK